MLLQFGDLDRRRKPGRVRAVLVFAEPCSAVRVCHERCPLAAALAVSALSHSSTGLPSREEFQGHKQILSSRPMTA